MKTNVFAQSLAALAFAAFCFAASAASAGETEDRTAAIRLCRAEIAQQAGVTEADARFDEVRVRSRAVRVDIDLWRDGQLTNVRCEVSRDGDQLTVASVSPALQLASAQ